jgi:cobalamin biosynthesis protein CobT
MMSDFEVNKSNYPEAFGDEEDDQLTEGSKDFNGWVEDDDTISVNGLLEDKLFDSVSSLVEYEKSQWNFDMDLIVPQLCDDVGSFIKMINFIRTFISSHSEITDSVVNQLKEKLYRKHFLSEELYMIPVLPNDPLLYMFEDYFVCFNEDGEKEDVETAQTPQER